MAASRSMFLQSLSNKTKKQHPMESPLSWIRWEKALLRGKTNGVKDDSRVALWLMLFVQAQETIGRSIGLLALLGQSYFILIEYLAVGNGISRTAVLCRTARKRTMELKRVRMADYAHITYSVAFFLPALPISVKIFTIPARGRTAHSTDGSADSIWMVSDDFCNEPAFCRGIKAQ